MEKKRVNWSELEVHFLLTIMRDNNILNMLDGKRHRNADIFKIVEEEMKKRGFLKSVLQIRTKWKALKLQYYKAKRANSISGNDRIECSFWDELEELLGRRPACNVEGIDTSCVLDETENFEGVVDVAGADDEVAREAEPEPTAGSSRQREPEGEPGPVRKKKKVEKKGGYNEALKSFSKDLKQSQEEVANMFLEKQADIIARELDRQRQWEQKIMEEDRVATEKMMTNLMSSFFNNLRQMYQQPIQLPFFNPSQAPVTNSVPVPFPSPPSGPSFPTSPVSPNPICVPLPCPSLVSVPGNYFYPSQSSSNPNSTPLIHHSTSSLAENNAPIVPSNSPSAREHQPEPNSDANRKE